MLNQVIEKKITPKEFKKKANKRFSFWQLANKSFNIRQSDTSCKHNCLYCYMISIDQRFGRDPKVIDMEDIMPTNSKNVDKIWRKADTKNVYFFPSSHDIFEENADDYVKVAKKIIDAGHEIVYITKPWFNTIKKISTNLNNKKYKEHIVFFMTITSNDNKLLKKFEPNASKYEERLKCLKYLHKNNFLTSVIIEPFLSEPTTLIDAVYPYVSEIIVVGEMNYTQSFIDNLDIKTVKYIEKLYDPKNMRKIFDKNNKKDKVIWKKGFFNMILKEYK